MKTDVIIKVTVVVIVLIVVIVATVVTVIIVVIVAVIVVAVVVIIIMILVFFCNGIFCVSESTSLKFRALWTLPISRSPSDGQRSLGSSLYGLGVSSYQTIVSLHSLGFKHGL